MFAFLDNGFLYCAKDKTLYSSPLSAWDDNDVWEYIRRYDVPYSPLYDLTDDDGNKLFTRNGCYVCGTGLAYEGNNIEILRKHYPAKWRRLMEYGMAREMQTFACAMCNNNIKLQTLESEYLIDRRPCALDRLTPRADIIKALRGDPIQITLFDELEGE